MCEIGGSRGGGSGEVAGFSVPDSSDGQCLLQSSRAECFILAAEIIKGITNCDCWRTSNSPKNQQAAEAGGKSAGSQNGNIL